MICEPLGNNSCSRSEITKRDQFSIIFLNQNDVKIVGLLYITFIGNARCSILFAVQNYSIALGITTIVYLQIFVQVSSIF